MNPRSLVLCADDFGASAAIDGGVLRLAAAGRLNAVSCLTQMPAWAQDGPRLAALVAVRQGRVRVGLHFNLTEGRPLAASLARVWPQLPSLPRLIALAHLRRLPRAPLQDEWEAQCQAFESVFGRPPAHVDGHQHIHHLPGVRGIVLAALDAAAGLTVRNTGHVDGPGHAVKRRLIEATGGRWLARRLQQRGRSANTRLLGVYDFTATDYRRLMQAWLAALPVSGGLVFCHPGEAVEAGATAQAVDPIAAARVRELAYLSSAAFSDDLAAAGVRLA